MVPNIQGVLKVAILGGSLRHHDCALIHQCLDHVVDLLDLPVRPARDPELPAPGLERGDADSELNCDTRAAVVSKGATFGLLSGRRGVGVASGLTFLAARIIGRWNLLDISFSDRFFTLLTYPFTALGCCEEDCSRGW